MRLVRLEQTVNTSHRIGNLKTAIGQIHRLIPDKDRFLLADGNTWGAQEIFGDRTLPVMECDGEPWGAPADTKALLGELERQRQRGIRFLVLAWPTFWWLDHYGGLSEALANHATCLLQDDLLAVYEFDLASPEGTTDG